VDDAISEKLHQLRNEVIDATEEVSLAIEAGEEPRELAVGRAVDDIVRRYNELVASAADADRAEIERRMDRKITDLRRAAAQLAQRVGGTVAQRAVDAGMPFILQRAPGRRMESPRHAPTRDAPRFSVGAEVDAWCGKCREMRAHDIIAIVSGLPKQVLCKTCRSRHGYREEPGGRNAPTTAKRPTASSKRTLTPEERQEQKRAEERRALIQELDAVAEPRPFDPRGRYRVGEVVLHPEHGKGKIENVLRGSMLVRFRDGLRPINLS
jgi:hypothetical protein